MSHTFDADGGANPERAFHSQLKSGHADEVTEKIATLASHARSGHLYGFTTLPEHMPEAHRKHFAGGEAVLA